MDEEQQEIEEAIQALIAELSLSDFAENAATSQHLVLMALVRVLDRVKALEA
tara:strand:+ start:2556 stop:2711 length:156 start_codon:yes stop_codon:yes gene_type:complete